MGCSGSTHAASTAIVDMPAGWSLLTTSPGLLVFVIISRPAGQVALVGHTRACLYVLG